MDWNSILFLFFPYMAITVAIVGTVYRTIFQPFSVSSLSSELLERRKLFWGILPFHWGIVLLLLAHLFALLMPIQLRMILGNPVRLYIVELTGLAFGIWALFGLVILVWRRISVRHIRSVTTWMDSLVLVLLLVSAISGIWVSTTYRFGSLWFTGIFTPYLWGLLTLQAQPLGLVPLPWIIKLHALNFFVLLMVLPFSRLVHLVAYPFTYILRPWQIVIGSRRHSLADLFKE